MHLAPVVNAWTGLTLDKPLLPLNSLLIYACKYNWRSRILITTGLTDMNRRVSCLKRQHNSITILVFSFQFRWRLLAGKTTFPHFFKIIVLKGFYEQTKNERTIWQLIVWMVSTCLLTFKSSRPFNNPSVTVPQAPVTIGTIDTFMFHSFSIL